MEPTPFDTIIINDRKTITQRWHQWFDKLRDKTNTLESRLDGLSFDHDDLLDVRADQHSHLHKASDGSNQIDYNDLLNLPTIPDEFTLGPLVVGAVLFGGPNNTIGQDVNNFFWDESSDILIIGGNTVVTGIHTARLQVFNNAQNVITAINTNTPGSSEGGGFSGRQNAIPVASGERMGFFTFGYQTSTAAGSGAAIEAYSDAAWTAGVSHPGYISIKTVPSGAIAFSERMRIHSNGRITIGESHAAPSWAIEIIGTANTERVQITSSQFPIFRGAKFNGTIGAETAVLSGNHLLTLQGGGHDGAGFHVNKAQIRMLASENWTGTAQGSRITFLTTKNSGTSTTEKFNIENDGTAESKNRFASAVTTPTYGTTVSIDSSLGDIFIITATDGVAFTVANPTNPFTGQQMTITIKNTSGGALGAVTWGSAYKLATWTSPATGFNRSITFYYDGTNWFEKNRTTADIPN